MVFGLRITLAEPEVGEAPRGDVRDSITGSLDLGVVLDGRSLWLGLRYGAYGYRRKEDHSDWEQHRQSV
jgi:hypothetical protein